MSNPIQQIENLSPDERRSLLAQLLKKKTAQPRLVPTSFAQQRLWFLDQLEPDSATYNIPIALRLTGTLDYAILQRTINELLRRHETLRTGFAVVELEPVQVILPTATIELEVVELSGEEAVAGHVREQAGQPFDLSRAPLVRVQLLRLSATEHVLIWVMHHIISDGWSMGVLVREVAALYEAYSAGRESPLKELPIQYGDYAVWQRERLQGEVLAGELEYWREQLRGAPAVLELATEKRRGVVPNAGGARYQFQLGAEVVAGLKELSQREEVTLFMTLLSGFAVLLGRYSGQGEVVIGTPIAGRTRAETEGLIGFFVNTLALRVKVGGAASFAALLKEVREVCLGAYAHQEVPFERLVEELRPERSLSHTPLFQVMMALQNAPREQLELPGLRLEPLEVAAAQAKFDLMLSLRESEGGELRATIEYATDLFDEDTIERLAGHLQVLLAAVVAEPEQRLAELPLLTTTERQQILHEWNKTRAEYASEKCLHELFEEQVRRQPEALALKYEAEELTYRELNERANQLARQLRRLGVRAESLVGIMMERSVEMVVALLGVLKAGGAYVPLDPEYPQERLTFMMEDAGIEVLLTQRSLIEKVGESNARVIYLDEAQEVGEVEAIENPVKVASGDNAAYVIYTSGSTGQPKGVVIEHRSTLALLHWARKIFTDADLAAVLASTSICFDLSVFELFVPLSWGGKIILVENPLSLFDSSGNHEVSLINTVPSAMAELVRNNCIPASTRVVNLAGEALQNSLVQQVYEKQPAVERILNLYGPSEDTTYSTFALITRGGTGGPLIGRPVANTEIYILDGQLQPVPVGVIGEIYIGGAGISRGYLNRPELTAERFIPNPFTREPGARLYRTGDLGRYLSDGQIDYVGRADNQVKIRGYRIELGEIEVALRQYCRVSDCVVVVREDVAGDKRLVAYVVNEGEGLAVGEFRRHLKQRLPEYMVPAQFVELESLPLTPNGKVDRRALPAPRPGLAKGPYAVARNATEDLMVEIWADVLGVERVGIHDDFFDLGGHSLLATQLVTKTRKVFGPGISLRQLFEQPTIAELAKLPEVNRRSAQGLEAPPIKAVSRLDPLPLSFAQRRLWFLDQLESASTAYNIPIAIRLEGHLDYAILQRTINELLRRHESLRTGFTVIDSQLVQVISPEAQIDLAVVDLSSERQVDREAEVRRLVQEQAEQRFDLSRAPLVRVQLLRRSDEEHVLICVMHHIITDGWSMGVLVKEVAALYEAYSAGRESPLAELPIQYGDYAVWQRERLQGEVLERELKYWKEQLGGAPPVLELPMDHPRPALKTFSGAAESLELSRQLSEELHALSRREGVTLFMTLLAAFAVLLSRYSGQTDINIGTSAANREQAEIEGLIGFFVNTLTLRIDLGGNPTFRQLLARVREFCLGAYAHQEVPFEKLVEELTPERSLSHTPLFQVMMVLQNAPREEFELPGLNLSPVSVERIAVKFDLSLSFMYGERGLSGKLGYDTDLFDGHTIRRMLNHFKVLLENILAGPQSKLSQLSIITGDERHQLLSQWSDTRQPYHFERCIHQLFEEQVEQTPQAIALVYENTQLTYRELNEKANQLAHYLRWLGVRRETLVGILMDRSIEIVVSVLATLKAGGAYVPLDPEYPQQRISLMVEDAGLRVLLTQERLRDRVPAGSDLEVVCVEECEQLSQHSQENPETEVNEENLAYVIYTSGSTGQPKGVQVTHSSLCNLALAQAAAFKLSSASRVLQFASLSFDASASELFSTWAAGATLVIARSEQLLPGAELRGVLEEKFVSTVTLPPSVLAILPAHELDSLHTVIAAGEACSLAMAEKWSSNRRLINAYGPTEATVCASYSEFRLGADKVTIGRPLANAEVYILDTEQEIVPVGVLGEIYIGGTGLSRGYLNRPELTAERFIPHPFAAEPGARLYRTGDLGRYLSEGEIQYVGRKDQQVKVRGYRIELGEVEAAIRKHGGVSDCVVVAREDVVGEKQLIAYVVSQAETTDTQLNGSELRRYLKGTLPEYMVPSLFVQLSSLPLTPNGKVDRRALPAPDAERPHLEREYVGARTELERLLVEFWEQSLGVERIGIHDNFFELGGDSIKGAVLINRLQQWLGEYVYVVALFDAPTVAELASYFNTHYAEAVARVCPAALIPDAGQEDGSGEEEIERVRKLIVPLPAATNRRSKNPQPIFILSAPRSGSTLLRVMLGGHSRLFAPPELELLSFNTLAERRDAFTGRDAFWLEGTLRALMQLHGCTAEEAKVMMQEYEDRGFTTHQFYGLLQGWLGGRRLIDKTPSYALDGEILRRMEEDFEDALYIHLVRHPQAMVRSFEEARLEQVFFRHAHGLSRRELAEAVWVISQQNIMEFLGGVATERQRRVSFEELVGRPSEVMDGVCGWLGLEMEDGVLEPYKERDKRMTDGIHPLSKMLGDVKFHEHQGIEAEAAERWRSKSEKNGDGRRLTEMTWRFAERLGYHREPDSRLAGKKLGPITTGPRNGSLPLSFAQQRLWLLDQLEPGSATYNIPIALRLRGTLDYATLQRTINELLRRHETLRTGFAVVELEPVQVILPAATIELEVVELSGEAAVAGQVREQAGQPFNLSRAPLVRVQLLRLSGAEHVLIWVMHHIISDGWSMGVLVREVAALYEAYSAGRESPLPELPIQYGDYAVWQRERLQGEVMAGELGYWREQLRGAPAVLELATEKRRGVEPSNGGARYQFQLGEEVVAGLKELSQREEVTLFMTLLSGFAVLLGRYSGQEEVVIGTPIAGRTRAETEGLIGFFVNTLALRVKVGGAESFAGLLKEVREVCLGAYAHQEVPFERLVEELRPERSLSHTPLFQVMMALQNAPREQLELAGLRLEPLEVAAERAKFDLMLSLRESEGGELRATIEYATDLFDEETIKRLAGHLQVLLAAVVAGPEQRLTELPLLTTTERQQILQEWNETRAEYASEKCLHELFEEQVARTPEALALKYEAAELSYGELNERANQLARQLRRLGVRAESLVGIMMERSMEMVVALLGVLKAGGAYVPLDPEYPQERLTFMMEDAGIEVLLTQRSLVDQGSWSNVDVVCLDSGWKEIDRESRENLDHTASADNLAYVIYTSGSTGKPKGVLIQHQGVCNVIAVSIKAFAVTRSDRVAQVASLSFDASVLEIFTALLSGASLHLFSRDVVRSGAGLVDVLRSQRITTMAMPPSLLSTLNDAKLKDLSTIIVGGEACNAETAAHWSIGRRFFNAYAPTEGTIYLTLWRHPEGQHQAPPLGRPIANMQTYVLDDQYQPVPIGVVGELYVAGVGLARGYLGQAALTAERFVPHPFSEEAGARLYRTGDLGRYGAEGEIEYAGRVDAQVKVRGHRIELGEIEARLGEHVGVSQCAVVAREEEDGQKRLVAYIVASGGGVSSSELRRHLKERLPEYMIPGLYVELETLPLTANGKVDRRALPAPEGQRPQLEERYVEPRSAVEQTLAVVWREVLRVERVGVQDNFFELGGDSILAIQVVAKAAQAGVHFTARQLFAHQCIAELAAVTEAGGSSAVEAPQGEVTGGVALTPIQRWFFEGEAREAVNHFNQAVLLEVRQRVEIDLLERAVAAVVAHHDGLRLRYQVDEEGNWQQECVGVAQGRAVVQLDDLSAVSGERQRAELERLADEMQDRLDIAAGPTVRVTLFELGESGGQRVQVVIHHLMVDGVSWRILLEDLEQAYGQLERGEEVRLRAKSSSFQQWAERLEERARSGALEQEAEYWLAERRSRVKRLRVKGGGGENLVGGAGRKVSALSVEETERLLREVSTAYRVRIDEVLLGALGETLRRWRGERQVLVEVEGHGREVEESEGSEAELEVTRTVGWFTTLYPVLLEARAGEWPVAGLKRVKEEVRGVPGRGIGYGLLRYVRGGEVGRRLRELPQAEVSFNYLGQLDEVVSAERRWGAAREGSGRVRSERGRRRHLISVDSSISGGQLRVVWSYSGEAYVAEQIEELAQIYLRVLGEAIEQSQTGTEAGALGYTPSDFPDAHLSQPELDDLIAGLDAVAE